MWERRYSAVEPHRTDTGRRLYTDDDIERLSLLRRATLAGESIGQIAHLSREELAAMIPESETPAADDNSGYRNAASIDQHLDLCVQSMKNLDAVELETRLLRASVNLGQRAFLEKLLHPLLEKTGEMWSDGRLHVAHEHLGSTVVRSLLGSMYLSKSADATDPLIISTTPHGQRHEFGALMASVTAASSGWRTVYLGANLPAEDIIEAAESRNADALALSIVYPSDDPTLPEELRKLKRLSESAIKIIAGGRSAGTYQDVLDEIGAIRTPGLTELRRELDRIKRTIVPSAAKTG
jgi:methanogenic corrinoid protein MtbC1